MSNENLTEIGQRIKSIRSALKMTQDEFAVETGISSSFVSLVETGAKKPSFELLFALRIKFDIDINFIFTGVRLTENSNKNQTYWDINPNLPRDPLIADLIDDLQVPLLYHSLTSLYLKEKEEYKNIIEDHYNKQIKMEVKEA